MARRDNADPMTWHRPGLGLVLASQPPHLYNRASADPAVNLGTTKPSVWSGGDGRKMDGYRCPRLCRDLSARRRDEPVHYEPEGVARFFARGNMAEGPFPEAL